MLWFKCASIIKNLEEMNTLLKYGNKRQLLKQTITIEQPIANTKTEECQYLLLGTNRSTRSWYDGQVDSLGKGEHICYQASPMLLDAVWLKTHFTNKHQFPYAILCEYSYFKQYQEQLHVLIQQNEGLQKLPFIVIVQKHDFESNPNLIADLSKNPIVDDCYQFPLVWDEMIGRVAFLRQVKPIRHFLKIDDNNQYTGQIPFGKRLFDIAFSLVALLCVSPILLLIALAIKLESKGPVFYKSKRAGTGYHVFDFYKFRSMTVTAEDELNKLQHLNQYANTENANTSEVSFVKINNDPRVTKVGWFIRKTSLDELPQLVNVLKGDMSIVGNRPLPLYEAEQLTRDIWALRFLAPAGITGLWQVTKRGNSDMSAEERIELDNTYADKCSFWFDLKIILRTFPAMLQKEAV